MTNRVQIAFVIVLLILSLVSTFAHIEMLGNIVLAIVLPSFLLTLIFFFDGIIKLCRSIIKAEGIKIVDEAQPHQQRMKALAASPLFTKDIVKEFDQERKIVKESLRKANDCSNSLSIISRIEEVLKYINIAAYVVLFLSLIFSPYIVDYLKNVDLNCITLWSLTILFVERESRDILSEWIKSKIMSLNKNQQ